ncbi:MAG: GNAT family N-acetyltransferase [Pseudomonadota bacterium]
MSPRIETERLILRLPVAEDHADWCAFVQSDRAEYVGRINDPTDAWRAFACEVGHWTMFGFGPFMVDLKESGQTVGSVGPWRPATFPENEIGWILYEGFEGKGYAFEAAMASRDWCYRTQGWTTLVSYISKPNAPSIALAEKMGAWRDDDAPSPFGDEDYVYRHPGPEALQ